MAKQTYGTGAFLLMYTGSNAIASPTGLLTTVAWDRGDHVAYALEGSTFIAGAAIQWLRDGLGLIPSAEASERLASQVSDANGVYFVPAFVGLGAPYWDPYARGTIIGLTRGVTSAHLVRAALEAIAYQTRDVLEAMQQDTSLHVPELRVDGGAATNNLLLQFQADILGCPLVRAKGTETTARGAAYLAGLAVDLWHDQTDVEALWQEDRRFLPTMSVERREYLYAGWRRAVERARGWASADAMAE
jgi:glycerol kinase